MTAERVWQLAQRYRWELLTLLLGLALANLWRLYDWIALYGMDPGFEPTASAQRFRWFFTLSNVPAVVVFGVGAVLLLQRGKTMLAGLWAIIWVSRAWVLFLGVWPQSSDFVLKIFGVGPNSFVGEWRMWAINATYQVIFSVIVSLMAWRLGRLGVLHALLLGAAALAWKFTGFENPWDVAPGEALALGMAWISVVLWLTMLGGLAFAFHEFPALDRHRQELAFWGLALLPLLSWTVRVIPSIVSRGRWSDFLVGPPLNVSQLTAAVAFGLMLTWLLATRWPVEQPRLDPAPTAPPNDD